MKKEDGLRELDCKKSFQTKKTMEEKQDGGEVMEARDGENGVTDNTTAVDMGLSKPQGCSQAFVDAEGESWQEFQDKFLMYALATDLAKESDATQVMMFRTSLDGEAVEAYDSFTYAPGESQHDLQCVITKYSEYYSASRARNVAGANDVTTKTHDH